MRKAHEIKIVKLKTLMVLLYRPKNYIHFEQTMQNMKTRAKVRIEDHMPRRELAAKEKCTRLCELFSTAAEAGTAPRLARRPS